MNWGCTEANTGEQNKVAPSHQPSTQSIDNTKFDGSGQYAAVLCHMDHLSATSKNAEGRAKFASGKMKSIRFAAFCHFLVDMFPTTSKLSLKMQGNGSILSVALSLLHEMIANVP